MSGGSMDHLYSRVLSAQFSETTNRRKAFRKHLNLIAQCLRAIEWNDSGDGASDEDALIDLVITPQRKLEQAIEDAEAMRNELSYAIQEAKKL